jgi:hypothetical protein
MILPTVDSVLTTLGTKTGASRTTKDTVRFPYQLHLTQNEIQDETEIVASQFHLDSDQRKVLNSCGSWFTPFDTPAKQTKPKVGIVDGSESTVQVNGVFGSGKTTLLVAICFLVGNLMYAHDTKCDALAMQNQGSKGSNIRILLASNTNRAVDNVMSSLLNRDFNSIARCGKLANVARFAKNFHVPQHIFSNSTLERYTILITYNFHKKKLYVASLLFVSRTRGDGRGSESDDRTPSEQQQIFERARVVGMTCATAKKYLSDGINTSDMFGTFAIVLFDNSTQVSEHEGMFPIRLAKCSAIFSVGDLKQVPPVSKDVIEGTIQTLFERLQERGAPHFLLRTQYRCPSYLANIAKSLLYNDTIKNGKDTESRTTAIPGLPCVVVVDIHDVRGLCNSDAEIKLVADTAYLLVTKAEVPTCSMCVITMFHDQTTMVFTFV